MNDARYLREQAKRCRRLSWWIRDPATNSLLKRMAQEFDQKAAELQKPASDRQDPRR
jgi:hypothetical protein